MSRYRAIVTAGIVLVSVLTSRPLFAQISNGEFAQRRAQLASEARDGLILAMGSAQPPEDYLNFYQNSPFRYLTGFREPNAALIALVRDGSVTQELLFVNPRNPAEETWEGYRIGPEGARRATGIPGRSILDLRAVFDSLVTAGWRTVHVVGPYDPTVEVRSDVTQRIDALLSGRSELTVQSASAHMAELRGVKSPAEEDLIRRAATITSEAQRELMRATAPAMNEFEIQALVEHIFRGYGAERPAFASIVGSGPNSTVLHYNTNDRFMEEGDVVVVDIGASYGGYAADITRTIPVTGRFTPEQREIYQLVRDAQATAESMARPGIGRAEVARAATEIIAQGLADLGLIESQWATYEDESGREIPQYFLYYMHALSHGLGLDVHDPWPSVLEPGVALTIEPGVYVRPNLFTEVVPDTPANREMRDAVAPAFSRYVGIGVRIEDDYIVSAEGVERISSAPREITEIEELMSSPWNGPAERNREWVEWYRRLR